MSLPSRPDGLRDRSDRRGLECDSSLGTDPPAGLGGRRGADPGCRPPATAGKRRSHVSTPRRRMDDGDALGDAGGPVLVHRVRPTVARSAMAGADRPLQRVSRHGLGRTRSAAGAARGRRVRLRLPGGQGRESTGTGRGAAHRGQLRDRVRRSAVAAAGLRSGAVRAHAVDRPEPARSSRARSFSRSRWSRTRWSTHRDAAVRHPWPE